VHGKVKDSNYFYEANSSIAADANLNIDGVMRALQQHVGKGNPLPPTLHIYSDQGEKCMAVLLAFAEVRDSPARIHTDTRTQALEST
jgi:hypothetical protein